jgi:hypothetical protein
MLTLPKAIQQQIANLYFPPEQGHESGLKKLCESNTSGKAGGI